MPLQKAKNKSKKSVQKAISANLRELKSSKTKRPMNQMLAIAISSAKRETKSR